MLTSYKTKEQKYLFTDALEYMLFRNPRSFSRG